MKKAVLALFLLAWTAVSFVTRPRVVHGARPMLRDAQIPPAVFARLDTACRDCHSDLTRFPWYSYVAPASILVNKDIEEGRKHMNLSQWAEYSSIRRQRALTMIANQVQDREMPLPIYTWLHHEAVLSDADRAAIFDWTQTEKARLIQEAMKEPIR